MIVIIMMIAAYTIDDDGHDFYPVDDVDNGHTSTVYELAEISTDGQTDQQILRFQELD